MKKYIAIFTIAVTGLMLNSCNQDLLDIEQQGALSMDTYYANATDDQAQGLIAHVYAYIYGVTGNDWLILLNGLSDDGTNTGGVYSNLNITSSNHPGNSLFTSLYRVNYLCNLIIERLPENSDLKKQIVGEAYFWRAWANLYLIRFWGNPPLVDHVLGSTELTPGNGTAEELWNYVSTSLQEAMTRLPEKAGLGGQAAIGGRVTKHSAMALLGKAQVIKGDYAGAITTLGTVINSGKYKLIDDYRQLYHRAADFCDEYMWEWNINDANVSNYTSEGDQRLLQLTWRAENVVVPGGFTSGGWGGADLNKNFYDFMVARGEKGKPRYLGTIWDYEDILQRFVDLGLATDTENAKSKFWGGEPAMQSCQGYFRCKMLTWADEVFPFTAGQNAKAMNNWPGMRYAEVLLLFAEACKQSASSETQGLAALNQVRVRAGLATLGSYTIQDLKDEKRAELAYEGERFLDLVRWGDASAKLANRGFTSYTFYGYKAGTTTYDVLAVPIQGAQGFQSGRDEHFPYPYSERLLNPNLVQNPGWN